MKDDAIRGAEATRLLRDQPVGKPADGSFERMLVSVAKEAARGNPRRTGFWLGTGVGGAIAAAFFAAVVTLGLLRGPEPMDDGTAEFYVSMSEPRNLNIAIDAETALPGATLSLTLYGSVELAGYTSQRHLTWTTDLDAGVNRLSLPIIAIGDSGGQVIVRLDHPDSQQEFLVALRHDG